MELDWTAVSKLLGICTEAKQQWTSGNGIDAASLAKDAGEALGIEGVGNIDAEKIGAFFDGGLKQAFEAKDAARIAKIMAEVAAPVKDLFLTFAKGGQEPAELVRGINEVMLNHSASLQDALFKGMKVPDAVAEKTSSLFGAYTFSVVCFAAVGKLYAKAAKDAAIAKAHRIEVEALSQEAIARLAQERKALDEYLSAYLLDRLEPFSAGVAAMDEAVLADDDDGFIAANDVLAQAFGYRRQFATAAEFDELMMSDEVFRL